MSNMKTEVSQYEYVPMPAMEEAFKRIYTLSPKIRRSLKLGPEGIYGSTAEIIFKTKLFEIEDILDSPNGQTVVAILREYKKDSRELVFQKGFSKYLSAEIAMVQVCGETPAEISLPKKETNGDSN